MTGLMYLPDYGWRGVALIPPGGLERSRYEGIDVRILLDLQIKIKTKKKTDEAEEEREHLITI